MMFFINKTISNTYSWVIIPVCISLFLVYWVVNYIYLNFSHNLLVIYRSLHKLTNICLKTG